MGRKRKSREDIYRRMRRERTRKEKTRRRRRRRKKMEWLDLQGRCFSIRYSIGCKIYN